VIKKRRHKVISVFGLFLFLGFLFLRHGAADIIELSSGEIILGEIISENESSVIIRSRSAERSIARAIRRSRIRSIKHIAEPPVTERRVGRGKAVEELLMGPSYEQSAPDSASRASYLDLENGFRFTGPYGWIKHSVPPIDGVKVLFNMSESPKRIFPGIALSVDDLGGEDSSIESFAEGVVRLQERSGSTLVDKIEKINIHGERGIRFVTESPSGDTGEGPFMLMHVIFKKDDKAISIMCIAKSEEFDQYTEDFDEAIESFRVLSY